MSNFDSEDFTQEEIKRTIHSAYAQVQNFGSKYYEDEEIVKDVKQKLRKGVAKSEIKNQLEEQTEVDDVILDNVIRRLEEEQDEQKFWTKSDKGVIKIIHISFKKFLEDNGFYKFNPEGSKNYVFVKVTNNLIDHTSEKEIKDFVLDYLIDLDDISVYNYFAESVKILQ